MGVVLTDEPGADSWPVTAATFILVHKSQDKPVQGKAVLDFFDWAFKNGAKSAEGMDYVPLPEAVTKEIRAAWGKSRGGGKAAARRALAPACLVPVPLPGLAPRFPLWP